jgi:DNA-binding NtrC family response regulator
MVDRGDAGAGGTAVPDSQGRTSVILAEDEMLIALTIQDILEDHGYSVCEIAMTAQSVVEMARRHRPDIALVDVNLARGSNGLDAIGPLSDIGVPSIVVSGHASPKAARAAGAIGMLSKPFHNEDLIALIEHVLKGPAAGGTAPAGLFAKA